MRPALIACCLFVACAAEKAPVAAAPAEAKLVVSGKVSLTVDSSPVTLDYDGTTVQLAATHKLITDAKGFTCFSTLNLALEKKDGSCRLELSYKPSPAGLQLAGGKFYASKGLTAGGQTLSLTPCVGWPGADKATKELVFDIPETADATLGLSPLGPGKANLKLARLDALKIKFNGTFTMKKLATKVPVTLGALTLVGSLESTGDPVASCGAAIGQTGTAQCSKQGKPGDQVGDIFRRETRPLTCDGEAEFDLGELCGNDAILIVDWRDWAKTTLLADLAQVRDAFKGKQIGIAVVVVEGKEKVVVCNPPDSGKDCKAIGPAATATECQAIAVRDNLAKDITLVFDKDKQMVVNGKGLTSTGLVPALLFAKPDGTIVKELPGPDKKAPTVSDITGAIQEVLDSN